LLAGLRQTSNPLASFNYETQKLIQNEKIIQNSWRNALATSGGRAMQQNKPLLYDAAEYDDQQIREVNQNKKIAQEAQGLLLGQSLGAYDDPLRQSSLNNYRYAQPRFQNTA